MLEKHASRRFAHVLAELQRWTDHAVDVIAMPGEQVTNDDAAALRDIGGQIMDIAEGLHPAVPSAGDLIA